MNAIDPSRGINAFDIPWKESYVSLRQWATWALVLVVCSTMVPAERASAQCPIFANQWLLPDIEGTVQLAIHALAVDGAGNVYVGDMVNGRIVKFTSNGTVLAQWGSFGAGDGQFSDLNGVGIAIDGSDNVYILDCGNKRVQRFTSSGTFVAQWPLQPDTSSLINGYSNPLNIAVDHTGSYIYVSDNGTYHIQKYTASGEFLTKWGSVGHGNDQFWHGPFGVAVDPSGNVYVAEAGQEVKVFTSDGDFITRWAGDPGSAFRGIAVDNAGNVYVVDQESSYPCCPRERYRVRVYSSSGAFLCNVGSYGYGDGQLSWPFHVAVDGAGDVYVSDPKRVERFAPAPVPATATTWGKLKASYR